MSSDIDIEKRLRSIEQKVDENSKMLRSIKRKQLWSFMFSITKILIFIGVFYYAYTFFEPFLLQIGEMYSSIQDLKDGTESFKGFNVLEFLSQ